ARGEAQSSGWTGPFRMGNDRGRLSRSAGEQGQTLGPGGCLPASPPWHEGEREDPRDDAAPALAVRPARSRDDSAGPAHQRAAAGTGGGSGGPPAKTLGMGVQGRGGSRWERGKRRARWRSPLGSGHLTSFVVLQEHRGDLRRGTERGWGLARGGWAPDGAYLGPQGARHSDSPS